MYFVEVRNGLYDIKRGRREVGRDTSQLTFAQIRTAVLDGNSYYFLRLEGQDTFYAVNAAENPLAVILNAGDQVTIAYTAGEGGGILSGTSVARAGETPVTFTPEEAPADAPAETGQPAEDAASSNQPT